MPFGSGGNISGIMLHQSLMRNRSRFLSLIQAGSRPRPDHVAPVVGSRYLAATLVFSVEVEPRRARPNTSFSVRPYSAPLARTPSLTACTGRCPLLSLRVHVENATA